MDVLIRGFENKITHKQVPLDSKAAELLAQIAAENGLELGSFKIVFDGVEVNEALTLAENGLVGGAIVDLALEVDGGKKKKKKKVYKTEKKKKHRHVNTKLRVLTYYNIKADGTAEPTKVKSPQCGEGTTFYMANHYDRYYCGKTRTTLKKEKPDPIKKKEPKKVEAKVDPKAAGKAGAKPAAKGKKK